MQQPPDSETPLVRPYIAGGAAPRPAGGAAPRPAGGTDPGATEQGRAAEQGTPASGRHADGVNTLRPYLLTSGRVRPIDESLEIEAQVVATPLGVAGLDRLAFEHRDIVRLCADPVSVAEVAARLGLHIGVARVLVGDLAALGYLGVLRPRAGLHRDVNTIERVIRGLESIR